MAGEFSNTCAKAGAAMAAISRERRIARGHGNDQPGDGAGECQPAAEGTEYANRGRQRPLPPLETQKHREDVPDERRDAGQRDQPMARRCQTGASPTTQSALGCIANQR